jgi:aldose 1-epimerase
VIELRAGDAVAVVDPEGGGRLTRLAVAGVDLLTPAGCFLMAPWAGRTAWGRFDGHALPIDQPPHAIHGTVRGVAWGQVDDATIAAPLGPIWPWPGRCTQRFDLAADHLRVTATVEAEGAEFPAALGWHPWFVKPAAVDLDAGAMWERDADHLPTGRLVAPPPPGTPLDDCFAGVRWPVVLRHADGRRITVDAEGCDHAVVYDELAHTTCVEPQTAPPDALNRGTATLVRPGAPLRAAVRIGWRHR